MSDTQLDTTDTVPTHPAVTGAPQPSVGLGLAKGSSQDTACWF